MKRIFLFAWLSIFIVSYWSCDKQDVLTMEKVKGDYMIESIDSCTQEKPGDSLRYLSTYDSVSGSITFNLDGTGYYALNSDIFCFSNYFKWKVDDFNKFYIEFDDNELIVSREYGVDENGNLSWIAVDNFCNETKRLSAFFVLRLSKQN